MIRLINYIYYKRRPLKLLIIQINLVNSHKDKSRIKNKFIYR